MTTETKHRRGTATQCNAFTPAEAEIVVDTTNDRLRVGDGIKVGGYHIPNHKDVQQQVFSFCTVGGSANSITLTSGSGTPVAAYASPLKLTFKATATNTSSVQVNVDGLGLKNVYQVLGGSVVALTGGEIVNGGIYDLTYDGVQFQLTNGAGVVVPTSASTSEISSETATDEFIRPDRLGSSKRVAKAWGIYRDGTLESSFNISSTTPVSGGTRFNFTNAMSTSTYAVIFNYYDQVNNSVITAAQNLTRTTTYWQNTNSTGTRNVHFVIFE